ncbi:MAG TPA: hypothetical protein VK588_05845 [Chitinophagaceae bacterium]|nr:hypothetical protein [Chitinophagaceae bacterium]
MDKEKKWDLKIALYGALIGGGIALLSTLTSLYFSNEDRRYDEKKAILNKKIELIDKTAKNYYQLPGVEEMFNYSFNKNIDTSRRLQENSLDLTPKDYTLSKELSLIRADFFATLLQDQLYFGPKTRNYLDSIESKRELLKIPWWKTPESSYVKLLAIMTSEL